MKMTTGTKRTYTRQEVARIKAIQAKKASKPADKPKGEVVPMAKKFVLQDLAPFDAMIGFTATNRGFVKDDSSRPFTTLKGVTFVVDGVKYERTCMAYGAASVAIDKLLAAGETMLEVQLTPNYTTMKISGLVVDGEFVSFPDDREPASTGDAGDGQDDSVPLAA